MKSGPTLSVVVACNGAPAGVERCLDALVPQLDGADVLVCCATAVDDGLRRRYADADVGWHVHPGVLVPVLWADGIARTGGDLVALTISPMRPRPNWLAALRAALEAADAVGGAIEPGTGLRRADLAEYFCRYAKDMLPFDGGPSLDLPGDNAGYRRESLAAVASEWEQGFWEPDVHRALATRGATLVRSPGTVVEMGRSAGARAFVRQRLQHGRAYGRSRGARVGTVRNLLGVALSPAVPCLLVARTVREATRRGSGRRLLRVLPLVCLFDAAWAAGEALGHVDALRRR